ncbi:MAG: hypothetical protein V1750_07540 [Acidobacteriota bacterium]
MEAIRVAAQLGTGPLVYLDTDILARRDLHALAASLARGQRSMHRFEWVLSQRNRAGDRRLYRSAREIDCAGYRVDRQTQMWNSGVIALPATQLDLIDRAATVCDVMLANGVRHRLIEQLAFSIVMSGGAPLHSADVFFDHYWANKQGYLQAIAAQQAAILRRGLTLDEALQLVREQPICLPLDARRRWWHRAPPASRPGRSLLLAPPKATGIGPCDLQLDGVERRVEQLLAEAAEGEEPATAPFAPAEG